MDSITYIPLVTLFCVVCAVGFFVIIDVTNNDDYQNHIEETTGKTFEEYQSSLPKTFKIYDNGIEYTNQCKSINGNGCAIIIEGKKINCEFPRMHGGVLNPVCIEVIMRSMDGLK